MSKIKRFIDIGANLTDAMYIGMYNGKQKHENDLIHVLHRSWESGLNKIIITGGNLEESKSAIELAKTDVRLFATVGCHPTRCSEFEKEPAEYLQQLKNLIVNNKSKVVALGECGLDYDRIQFCPIDTQKKYFEMQLQLSESLKLPLFLHCRNAASDLYNILVDYKLNGVVHSFDGTIEEAKKFIDLGYFIGLNGCSLKTEENLKTVAELPIDRILIETDCPWCEIRPTHAGYKYVTKECIYDSVKKEKWSDKMMVKGRNEPANIGQVIDVIAAIKNDTVENLSEVIYDNTMRLFFSK